MLSRPDAYRVRIQVGQQLAYLINGFVLYHKPPFISTWAIDEPGVTYSAHNCWLASCFHRPAGVLCRHCPIMTQCPQGFLDLHHREGVLSAVIQQLLPVVIRRVPSVITVHNRSKDP